MVLKPNASYPGVVQVIDCAYALSWSVSPARVVLTVAPQEVELIQGTGDVVITDDVNPPLLIADCQVVDMSAPDGDSGPILLVLEDGRWRWDFGGVFGNYNQPADRSQTVPLLDKPLDPHGNQPLPPPPKGPDEQPIRVETRKTAPELAKILLKAMGVTDYDVSALDPKATPRTVWDATNPALALQQLASDLGCAVVFRCDTKAVLIAKQGFGEPLPSEPEPLTESPELKARPRPEAIACYGAPDLVQMRIPLVPAGRDFDGTVKPLEELSYRPISGTWDAVNPNTYANLAPDQFIPGARTRRDAQALARRSVWYYFLPDWRADPNDPDGESVNPVIEELEKRLPKAQPQKYDDQWPAPPNSQTPPTGRVWAVRLMPFRCQLTYDDLGRLSRAPAIARGRHSPPEQVLVGNDIRTSYSQTTPDTEVLVPFDIEDVGNGQQVVVFSHWICGMIGEKESKDGKGKILAPTLTIECACEIALDDWQWHRTPFTRKLHNGTPGTRPAVIVREDVHYQLVAEYKKADESADENGNVFLRLTDNKTIIRPRADYYLAGEARKYELQAAEEVSYPGIIPIRLDGAIRQVSWSLSQATTRASLNTEHASYLPSFEERQKAEHSGLDTQRRDRQWTANNLAFVGASGPVYVGGAL